MCNKRFSSLSQSSLQSETPVDQQPFNNYHQNQAVYLVMDSPSTAPNSTSGSASTLSSTDETPRVKFLCSFSGSILPRPQDGKLRYVGGETRIVSVPRDITYEELMNRMRELFEGASVLKYQQPDEDLDALVSVVNDDDVTNMMEEYDKLGSGDGFTRLRIFLFAHQDQDGSLHYIDGDERNTERRYVDALNNMNDLSDFRKQQVPESLMVSALDDMHLAEQFFSPRNNEIPINLNHLSIPHVGSGQFQQPVRYNEMEGPWSPAYYSPRHHGHHEYPSSPSSVRYGLPFGELSDKCLDRLPDEYAWQQVNHQSAHDHHHQQQLPENIMWVPTTGAPAGDMGFPGNILPGPSILDGNNVCEPYRMPFDRNQSPHLEQPNMGNGLPELGNPCAVLPSNRESYMLNANMKLHHANFPRDQKDPRILHSEQHSQERGWVLPHQMNPHVEDVRVHVGGAVRLNDYYVRDGPSMNFPVGHSNLVDGHPVSTNYGHHPDLSNEVFHDPTMGSSSHTPLPEERGVRHGNLNYAYGVDGMHMLPQGHMHPQTLWRNVPNTVHGTQPFEASRQPQPLNGTINPRLFIGVDSQNVRPESQQNYGHALIVNPNSYVLDNLPPHVPDIRPPQSPAVYFPESSNRTNIAEEIERSGTGEEEANKPEVLDPSVLEQNGSVDAKKSAANAHEFADEKCLPHVESTRGSDHVEALEPSVNPSSLSQQLNVSLKPSASACEEDAKAEDREVVNSALDKTAGEAEMNEAELSNNQGDLELESEDTVISSKIEPTKAEAEAIARGLQTIRNDDLEEIRELGSGTYGAVYHGKWRGSDVAIKRIKASCFAGRPAERERLIGDFWKEALILSSLHHPNVVSFYGIVRDGPDGSLATVTEFMVNGSLKQFLQKKDRTIDRRKRLIIAMDAAFGMEYLHGKNIVHFDLKCENLLVNMRDPQRPVCKIGDLGLSKVKQHTLVSGGVRGTLPWMAPELLSGKSHMVSEKIDVYSFGIVMWELLTGEEPYAHMHCASIIGGIVNNSLRPQIPTWCDPEWKSLMESCWASDPLERPSFSEISQKLRSMAAAINVKYDVPVRDFVAETGMIF